MFIFIPVYIKDVYDDRLKGFDIRFCAQVASG